MVGEGEGHQGVSGRNEGAQQYRGELSLPRVIFRTQASNARFSLRTSARSTLQGIASEYTEALSYDVAQIFEASTVSCQ